MNTRILSVIAATLMTTASGWAQVVNPPVGGKSGDRNRKANRFSRARAGSNARGRATTRRRTRPPSKQQRMFSEANALATKVHRSGPWEKHARDIERGIESIWAQDKMETDTDLFVKRLLIDVSKKPPWDFNDRLNVAAEIVKERYGLSQSQIVKLRGLVIRNSFTFFMQNAEKLMPVAREIIETRLANKPFTPEKVAAWSKVLRPITERWLDRSKREVVQFASKNLTPAQRAKVNGDLAVIEKRVDKTMSLIKGRWETGQWLPEMWGLEKDPVHVAMQTKLDAERRAGKAAKTKARPEPTPPAAKALPEPPARPGSLMRLGQTPGRGGTQPPEDTSHLPDETKWVAYVRQLCDRYDLDKAQRTSAYAILKDLQEQARTYRGSRIDDIKRLEDQMHRAETSEERRNAQAELGEVLRGIDELFEELKGRLKSIPTGDQIRRSG